MCPDMGSAGGPSDAGKLIQMKERVMRNREDRRIEKEDSVRLTSRLAIVLLFGPSLSHSQCIETYACSLPLTRIAIVYVSMSLSPLLLLICYYKVRGSSKPENLN